MPRLQRMSYKAIPVHEADSAIDFDTEDGEEGHDDNDVVHSFYGHRGGLVRGVGLALVIAALVAVVLGATRYAKDGSTHSGSKNADAQQFEINVAPCSNFNGIFFKPSGICCGMLAPPPSCGVYCGNELCYSKHLSYHQCCIGSQPGQLASTRFCGVGAPAPCTLPKRFHGVVQLAGMAGMPSLATHPNGATAVRNSLSKTLSLPLTDIDVVFPPITAGLPTVSAAAYELRVNPASPISPQQIANSKTGLLPAVQQEFVALAIPLQVYDVEMSLPMPIDPLVKVVPPLGSPIAALLPVPPPPAPTTPAPTTPAPTVPAPTTPPTTPPPPSPVLYFGLVYISTPNVSYILRDKDYDKVKLALATAVGTAAGISGDAVGVTGLRKSSDKNTLTAGVKVYTNSPASTIAAPKTERDLRYTLQAELKKIGIDAEIDSVSIKEEFLEKAQSTTLAAIFATTTENEAPPSSQDGIGVVETSEK